MRLVRQCPRGGVFAVIVGLLLTGQGAVGRPPARADAPWSGTVTLTVDRAITDANGPTARLTATVSQSLRDSLSLSFYDDQGRQFDCSTSAQSTFTTYVSPSTNATRTYTAYVAQDCPGTGPPVTDVKSSSQVTITNLGFTGGLSVSTDGARPSARLTITLGATLPSPYAVSVYSSDGARAYCSSGHSSTFATYVSAPTEATMSYIVYVAQDCPGSGAPTVDVRSFAGVTFTPAGVSSTVGGLGVEGLADLADGLDNDAVLAAVLLAPGTHTVGSSESDEALAYEAARVAGATRGASLKAALAVGGAATSAFALFVWTDLQAHPSPPPPPTAALPPPTTPSLSPLPSAPQPTYEDDLTARLLQRDTRATVQQARIAARHCIATVQAARSAGAALSGDGQYPCDALAIYLPGSEYPQPTRHDYDAIFGNGTGPSNVDWVRLTYVSQTDRINSRLPRDWAKGQPECRGLVGEASGKDCDEYPFYSSGESGPGANLRPLDAGQNRRAGGRYGVFVTSCGLTSGGPAPETHAGSPFLVVPMSFPGAPATLHFCR